MFWVFFLLCAFCTHFDDNMNSSSSVWSLYFVSILSRTIIACCNQNVHRFYGDYTKCICKVIVYVLCSGWHYCMTVECSKTQNFKCVHCTLHFHRQLNWLTVFTMCTMHTVLGQMYRIRVRLSIWQQFVNYLRWYETRRDAEFHQAHVRLHMYKLRVSVSVSFSRSLWHIMISKCGHPDAHHLASIPLYCYFYE